MVSSITIEKIARELSGKTVIMHNCDRQLQGDYSLFVQRELKKSTLAKELEWSRGIAVGSEDFVSSIQNSFEKKTEKRKIENGEKTGLRNVIFP